MLIKIGADASVSEDMLILLENDSYNSPHVKTYSFQYDAENSQDGLKIGLEHMKAEVTRNDDNEYLNRAEITRKEFKKLDLITTFHGLNAEGEDVYIAVCYNKEGHSMYMTQVDKKGSLEKTDGGYYVYDLFTDNCELVDGDIYTIDYNDGVFYLKSDDMELKNDPWDYFDLGKVFNSENGMDWSLIRSLSVLEADSSVVVPGDNGESEENETDAEDVNGLVVIDQTDEAETQAGAEQDTAAEIETQVGDEQDTTVAATEQLVDPEPEPVDNTTGLIVGMVLLGLIAAGAVAGCVMLFRKMQEYRKKAETPPPPPVENTEKTDDQQKIEAQEKEILEAQKAIVSTKKEADDVRQELQTAKKQLEELRAKEQKAASEYAAEKKKWEEDESKLRVRCAHEEKDRKAFEEQVSELKAENERLKATIAEMTAAPKENEDLLIAINEDKLNDYPQAVFLDVVVSFTGDVELTEVGFNRAHLAVINNKAYPNAYLLTGLKEGFEHYDNLESLQHVFEMIGMANNGSRYGLADFTPAIIEKIDGKYTVITKGTMRLTT